MKSPVKIVSLPEDTYNILRAQAEKADRTLGGQVRFLLRLNAEREAKREAEDARE